MEKTTQGSFLKRRVWLGMEEMWMLPYDKTSPESIEAYAKGLIGKTFQQVLEESEFLDFAIQDSNIDYYNPKQKGKLGNLLEEKYFGFRANSNQEPDFPEAQVELKATCFDVLKNGRISAGERLVLTMISYEEEVEHDFYKSHVWEKCRRILLVYYERNRKLLHDKLYQIHYVNLVSPAKKDMPIILRDYNKIIEKIESGTAETLSESDTMYLGACTKGATAAKSVVMQFYPPHTPAKKRAFCFKRQYMDYILHAYIMPEKTTYEPLIKDAGELAEKTFEDIITDRIKKFYGKSDKELCTRFHREYNNNKAQWTDLTYRMLEVKGNHAEEFQKANIVVKVSRIEEDGSMNESISFPSFQFKELVQQQWEESDIFEYFDETRFFFVIFKRDGDVYRLHKCQFWNMPYADLNGEVKEGWEKVKHTIQNGVTFHIKQTRKGPVVENNLLKKGENRIIHIRPHAAKAAYQLKCGFKTGKIEQDANELPDGQFMTTQSFWMNNSYILEQLNL